jgi:beta-mannosidase
MYFVINGLRILARGSSLVPLNSFPGELLNGTYSDQILKSVIAANMNMIRIWGGGIYQPTAFYEACDRLGIMLFHDFMFSWYPNVPYPAFKTFLKRVKDEITEKTLDLSRHPSIVLWSGSNEDQCTRYNKAYNGGTGCQAGVPPHEQASCEQIYQDCVSLYVDTVLTTVSHVDRGSRPIWPQSPAQGFLSGVDRATGRPLIGHVLRLRNDGPPSPWPLHV